VPAARRIGTTGDRRRDCPTAEDLFRTWPGVQVASAGLKADVDEILTAEDLEWADLVLVMEKRHKQELSRRFMSSLRDTPVAVLGIPDDYDYMAPELVELLLRKVPPYLSGDRHGT
jgi:predicted protein tyrosine phosphatase